MSTDADVPWGPLRHKYPVGAGVLAAHPECRDSWSVPASWREGPRWRFAEPPLRVAYASQIAQAEEEAYAEDADRSRQQQPAATEALLPSPEQVAATVTADEAAHAGETLPPGQDQTYGASAPEPPDEGTDSWFRA